MIIQGKKDHHNNSTKKKIVMIMILCYKKNNLLTCDMAHSDVTQHAPLMCNMSIYHMHIQALKTTRTTSRMLPPPMDQEAQGQ